MYSSSEIKEQFLNFFIKNGHLKIDGSSVIPKNDPTLLYINAGMAAIKNYFTGDEVPPQRELCNVQSCIRTIDIDDIGDRYHLTSFHMLGSWSIGSYFKKHAIELAFDFLVNILRIPIDKLYVSVFLGNKELNLPFDSESKKNWIEVGIPENHIVSFGMEDNFWGPASETGPCGPCTEVFFDTGIGKEYSVGGFFDTSRYIEIWNAGVFMMFNKDSNGSFSNLAFNSVDTGAGLERLTMTLNGLKNVYETDLILPIYNFIDKNLNFDDDKYTRILTDHLRTVSLILSENQEISNEGRGYIPRKLIRKCISISKKSKRDFDLSEIVNFIADNDEDLCRNKKNIVDKFSEEKNKFEEILNLGLKKLEVISKGGKISSKDAFDLVTSSGLPFEFIKDYADENSIKVNEKEFENLLEKHKEISRANVLGENNNVSSIFDKISDIEKTKFIGYSSLKSKSKVLKLFSKDLDQIESTENHDEVFLILDVTPVYARSGGQESDISIIHSDSCDGTIEYAIKKDGVFVHFCKLKGKIKVNDEIEIQVDENIRRSHERAHSATHLLQSALRKLFGLNVHQKGSKVSEDLLHFDFNFQDKISRDQICELEKIVNENICKNIPSDISEMPLNEAVSKGATAIFSEKYGNIVRVVSFGDISKELCGGTHVSHTGDIGMFIISSCESIGKGIKRISAFCSTKALDYVQSVMNSAFESSEILHVKVDELPNTVSKLNVHKKEVTIKKIDRSSLQFLNTKVPFAYFICDDDFSSGLVSDISEQISGIFFIVSLNKKRISLSVSKKINDLSAKDLLLKVLEKLGGKGGGSQKIASGGFSKNISEKDIIKYFDNEYKNKI